MKRLIRKAKWLDSFEHEGETYEIFENPNMKECQDARNQSYDNNIRGLINRDGQLYIWASDILHDELPYCDYGIHFDCDFDNQELYLNLDGEATKDNISSSLKAVHNNLNSIGIIDNFICSMGALEFNDETDKILQIYRNLKTKTLANIINMEAI